MGERADTDRRTTAAYLGGRALRVLAIGSAALVGLAALPHLGGRSSPPPPPESAQTKGVGGFHVAVPLYTLAPWDPTRIASFSFRLTPVTPATHVRAGVRPAGLADRCRVGIVTAGTATVTCSYERTHAPLVRDALALTVLAST